VIRDGELRRVIARVFAENYVAYGADKMWDHLNQVEGIRVARCTWSASYERWVCQACAEAAPRSAPRSATTAPNGQPICSTGTLPSRHRTACGWQI
jgi:hypothetical protein